MHASPATPRHAHLTHARGSTARIGLRLLACLVATAVVALAALASGTSSGWDPHTLGDSAVLMLRLPRVVLTIVAGASLAGSGVAFQALLGNPLADPFIVGVSGGAALGGTLALFVGGATATVTGCAFVGALAAALGGFALSRRLGGGPLQLLLAGVVFNAFAAAVITYLKTVSSAQMAQQILFWLMGTVPYPTWPAVIVSGCCVGVGLAVLLAHAGHLNIMSFGDETAAGIGVDTARSTLLIYGGACLAVGAVVSLVGMIGFVGLVVPHLLRIVWGADHRLLLPAALIVGAGTLCAADALARALFPQLGTTVPVGVVTAFFGGPFFIALMVRGSAAWRSGA